MKGPEFESCLGLEIVSQWPFSNSTCCSHKRYGVLNPYSNGRTTKHQVYTVIDYADDGGRMWMNAKVPFTVY